MRRRMVRGWMGAVAIAVGGACSSAPPPPDDPAVEVAAAASHTCARLASGAVACWGRGTLGDGVACDDTPCSATPVLVSGLDDAVSVSADMSHSCAARATGEVVCWGQATWGDDAISGDTIYETPRAVPGISNAVAVSAHFFGACALLASGEVVCWGLAEFGLLGDGEEDHEYCRLDGLRCSRVPVSVQGVADAIELSTADAHGCALRAGGGVACWGADSHPIDDGSSIGETHWGPVDVEGISDAVAVAAGAGACAVTAAGAASCWRAFDADPPPTGDTLPGTPRLVAGLAGAVDIDDGLRHRCVVFETGRVSCWGMNDRGQLGTGESGGSFPDPVDVVGLDDAVAVTAGHSHTCALQRSGHVACWGNNGAGQLGDGTTVTRAEPGAVAWPQ